MENLPNELLIDIFDDACDREFDERGKQNEGRNTSRRLKPLAQSLSMVCRAWRILVRTSPIFWVSAIYVNLSLNGRERLILDESANSDLDIEIYLPKIMLALRTPQGCAMEFLERHLLPKAQFWRRFHSEDLEESVTQLIQQKVGHFRSLPRLRSLHLCGDGHILGTFPSTPKLSLLHLDGILWEDDGLPIKQLSALVLRHCPPISLKSALQPSSSSLVMLQLSVQEQCFREDIGGVIPFPSLTTLSLCNQTLNCALIVLSAFCLPRLEVLSVCTLSGDDLINMFEHATLRLPVVITITLNIPANSVLPFLSLMSSPALSKLSIKKRNWDPASQERFQTNQVRYFPTLKTFSCCMPSRPTRLQQIFDYLSFDAVTELRLEGGSKSVWRAISPTLFPSLNTLFITNPHSLHIVDPKSLRSPLFQLELSCQQRDLAAFKQYPKRVSSIKSARVFFCDAGIPLAIENCAALINLRSLELELDFFYQWASRSLYIIPTVEAGGLAHLPNLSCLYIYNDKEDELAPKTYNALRKWILIKKKTARPLEELRLSRLPQKLPRVIGWLRREVPQFGPLERPEGFVSVGPIKYDSW